MKRDCYQPIFRGQTLADDKDPNPTLEVVGWLGWGEPGPRTVRRGARAKARSHRKAVRAQKRHMREQAG